MARQERHRVPKYAGVFFIVGQDGQKIFYIQYRRAGKLVEEKVGKSRTDNVTAAKANNIRGRRIDGEPSNNERRKAAAEAKEAEASRPTISRLWALYKEDKPGLKGIATDENRFKNFIEPHFGGKLPSELAPLDVDRVRLALLKTKAPATVKNVLELLRRIINFGVNKLLCNGTGFKIQFPHVNNIRTEDLSPEDLSRLLKAIEENSHPQAGPMMLLALYSGMRRGEMFRLKWRDIDFEKGFITLRDPKGGTDQKIPINDAAREVLENHPKREGCLYVFPGRGGGRRKDINKPLSEIKEAAGLPADFRALHGLRHAFASMLASSGKVDLYTLQRLLTHKSPMMTQRYAHLQDDALKRASNLAGNIVADALTGKIESIQK